MSTQGSAKTKIAIIYGGKSGEHEVSLKTAAAVIHALNFNKYDVFPIYITKNGGWHAGAQLLDGHITPQDLVFQKSLSDALANLFHNKTYDVAVPLLHGTFGEDGTIQGLLEMADLPYVGTGVMASSIGMDKVMMKKVFAEAGLPQCKFVAFSQTQWKQQPGTWIEKTEQLLGYPNFIKPANAGSSVGISKAKNRLQLLDAIELAFKFDRKIVIEEAIDAREVEVSVLGHHQISASVVGEIVPSNEFYDYQAKYLDGKSQMIIPADLPEETSEHLRMLAIQAFQELDGSGLSRVDFFVERTTNQVYLNEINTMPGFTPFSMYPLLWKASGKSYDELLDELIELAFVRHQERAELQYSIENE